MIEAILLTILRMTPTVARDSYCDLPEITEEALTRELTDTNGAAAADVGPFHTQYRCILGFVAQTCYVYVLSLLSHYGPRPVRPSRMPVAVGSQLCV
jgi:hypothetical protein